MPDKFLYLFLDGISILFPLLASFDRKVRFASKWKALFPALALPALLFLAWDVLYTNIRVWGFNERYLTGLELWGLPLEEYLFFLCIPYACLFIYEVLRCTLRKAPLKHLRFTIALAFGGILLGIALFNTDKLYTCATFSGTAVLLFAHALYFRPEWLGTFWLAYLIILIPFFIINGVLTGTGIEEEIVRYDDSENLGIRLGTIPIEDSIYGLFLILLNASLFEGLLKRS